MKKLVLLVPLLLLSCSSQRFFIKDSIRIFLTVAPISWSLSFPEGDYSLLQQRIKPDKSAAYFMLSSKQSLLNVSFFFEPITECTTAECCRDVAWAKHKTALSNPKDIQLSTIGDAATYEYLLPELLNQKNLNAHFYKEGYWIDVHISKIMYQEQDREQFVNFVKSITFVPKPQEEKIP